MKIFWIFSCLFASTVARSDTTWLCTNSAGQSISITATETPYTPFITVESEKVTTKGFAHTLKFAEGLTRYSLRSSGHHMLNIDFKDGKVKAYWPIGSSVSFYQCQ